MPAAIGIVAAAAAVAAAVAPAQAVREPALHVVRERPLVIAGRGFGAGERVALTALTSLGPRIVRVRASAAGRFTARFALFTQPCGRPFAVRARGSAGSVALIRLAAPPCVPPPVG
jgi:hypothetical protein